MVSLDCLSDMTQEKDWTCFATDKKNASFAGNSQIQAFSRTFRQRFKDFQVPCLFSKTLEALKNWEKFKDFQGPTKAL